MKFINITDFMFELEAFIYDEYDSIINDVTNNFNFEMNIISNDKDNKIIGIEYKFQSIDDFVFKDINAYYYAKYKTTEVDVNDMYNGKYGPFTHLETFIDSFNKCIIGNHEIKKLMDYFSEWCKDYPKNGELPIFQFFQEYKMKKTNNLGYYLVKRNKSHKHIENSIYSIYKS